MPNFHKRRENARKRDKGKTSSTSSTSSSPQRLHPLLLSQRTVASAASTAVVLRHLLLPLLEDRVQVPARPLPDVQLPGQSPVAGAHAWSHRRRCRPRCVPAPVCALAVAVEQESGSGGVCEVLVLDGGLGECGEVEARARDVDGSRGGAVGEVFGGDDFCAVGETESAGAFFRAAVEVEVVDEAWRCVGC